MKPRPFVTPLLVGLAILALAAVGTPEAARAGNVGFAAGGNTPVGTYPVGIPTGSNPAWAPNGGSLLGIGIPMNTQVPDNYMYAGTCPWVQPALAAEGYSFGNGANQWQIVYQPLKMDDITLSNYGAYVNYQPPVSLGGLTVSGSAAQGYGGATIAVGYAPTAAAIAAGDPNPANTYLNWIQVVATNQPSAFGTGNANGVNVGGGNTAYIDDGYLSNAGNGYNGPLPNNPFYGGINSSTGAYAGNNMAFLDAPSRQLPTGNNLVDWQAQVFLASWSPNVAPGNTNTNNAAAVIGGGGTITIYDGVWWGFQLTSVPEPSTYALAISGGLCGLVVWSNRTVRQRRKKGTTPGSARAA